MVTDEQRTEVIVALADARLAILGRARVNQRAVRPPVGVQRGPCAPIGSALTMRTT